MLNAPTFLGISMAPQKNRRLLLTVMYTVLLACAAVVIIPPLADRIPDIYVLYFSAAVYILIPIRVFPRLLKIEEFENRSGAMIVQGMQPDSPEMEQLDEREIAIRNVAHYQAFRIIKVCSIVVLPALSVWQELRGPTMLRFAMVALLILLLMTFTLPQAIILWTEADVPEEAQI